MQERGVVGEVAGRKDAENTAAPYPMIIPIGAQNRLVAPVPQIVRAVMVASRRSQWRRMLKLVRQIPPRL